MRSVLLILLFTLLSQPAPDPHLTARWTRPSVVAVSWTQQQRGCLANGNVLIGCWNGAGRVQIEIGGVGPVDANARGSAYQAEIDGVKYRARVRGVVLLPVLRA